MRASVGGWSLFNIFMVFFIILAFLLTGTVMYYKGYKVNSAIAKALETYEGYNKESAIDINRVLGSIGYRKGKGNNKCSSIGCLEENSTYDFKLECSKDRKNHGDSDVSNRYVSYKITTYIYIDLPLGVGTIKLPVTARTNPIYRFTGSENALGCDFE